MSEVNTNAADAPASAAAVPAEAPAAEPSLVTETPASPTEESKAEPKKETPAEPKPLELKLPEGSKLDPAILGKVEALAKEHGLSNQAAQAIIDDRNSALEENQKQQQSQLETLNSKTWKEELMSDPEVGGQKFEENGHLAYRAAEKWGGKEFAEELKTMNLNHHPKLFRMLARIGRASLSDNIPPSGLPGGMKSIAEKLYGKTE